MAPSKPASLPTRPDANDRLDEETVRVLTERRENPGPLRPWEEAFRELKKAGPEPQPPR
jgi:hypothetical protein